MRPWATSMPSGTANTSVKKKMLSVTPAPSSISVNSFHSRSGSLKNLMVMEVPFVRGRERRRPPPSGEYGNYSAGTTVISDPNHWVEIFSSVPSFFISISSSSTLSRRAMSSLRKPMP